MNSPDDTARDLHKQDRTQIEMILRQAGATVTDRRHLKCPFHDDKHPSAEIRQAVSGFWNFYCYTCGISEDVWALRARVSGQSVGDLLRGINSTATQPKPVIHEPQSFRAKGQFFSSFAELINSYTKANPNDVFEEKNPYTDPATGTSDFYTLRLRKAGDSRKTFRQVSRSPEGWQWKAPDGKLPLFNRSRGS